MPLPACALRALSTNRIANLIVLPSLVAGLMISTPAGAAPHLVSTEKTPAKTDGKQAKANSTKAGSEQAKKEPSSTVPPGYNAMVVLNNAKRLRAKKKINEAIAELDRGLNIRRDPVLLWEKANYLYEMERIPEAIKALEESLKAPIYPDQYKKLAECYLGLNELDKAQDALTRGLKQYPKSWALYMERAQISFANKDYENVLKDLAQAERLGKLGVDERRTKAKSLLKLDRYAEAAEQFQKLRNEKLHNGEADTMGLLECWLQMKTHPDDVIAVSTESIENSTSLLQGAFLRMRARAYRQKGKPKAAQADEANADKLDFDLEPGMIHMK